MDQTSQPIDVLLSVTRNGSRTLAAQIEDQLRRAIRKGALKAGARIPSTRTLPMDPESAARLAELNAPRSA